VQGMLQDTAGFNVDVEQLQLIEEFKTHLVPSSYLLAMLTMRNLPFPIPPFSDTQIFGPIFLLLSDL